MSIFRPKEILQKYTDFDYQKYRKLGFDTIFIDIDNTIDYPDSKEQGTKEAFAFLHKLEDAGFKIYLVSNNKEERIKRFLGKEKFKYVDFAMKPLPFKYLKLIKDEKLDKKKIITIGDQLMTDVLGANLLGLYPIYVKQLVPHDIAKTRLNRKMERFVFKHILHEKV